MSSVRFRAAGAARYATVAIVLHWLIAAAILLQVILAGRMEGRTPEAFAVIQLHKSVGITILLLSFLRLGWRLMNPPPPMPDAMARWEKGLARVVHVGLYVIMIGMPLTGWLMVSASRIEIPTYLYGVVPWPNLPLGDLAPAAKRTWHEVGEVAHGGLAKVLYVLAALHVAGALKHQLFSRDEPVLGRMAPGAVPGRWLDWRIFAIAAAALAVIAFGRLVEPPPPATAPPQASAPEAAPSAAPASAPTETDASATEPPPAAAAEPARWRVGPGSTLGFTTAWGDQAIQGRFDRWRAGIVFGQDALEKSGVTVVVDLASVKTGDQQRDETLPSGDWFDTAEHPQAVYRTTRIRHLGGDRYLANGTLELRGVKRPLDLPFTLKIDGGRAEATATATVDRTVFGVGQGEFAATDQIPAQVQVRAQVHGIRDER